jgi:hypothetical protein
VIVGRGSFSNGGRWRLHAQTFPEELNFWLEKLFEAENEGLPDEVRARLRNGDAFGGGTNWNEKVLASDEVIRAKQGMQYDNTHVVPGQVRHGAHVIRAELDTGEVVETTPIHSPELPVDFFVADAPYPKWVVVVAAYDEAGQRLGMTTRWEPTEWNRQRRDQRASPGD